MKISAVIFCFAYEYVIKIVFFIINVCHLRWIRVKLLYVKAGQGLFIFNNGNVTLTVDRALTNEIRYFHEIKAKIFN